MHFLICLEIACLVVLVVFILQLSIFMGHTCESIGNHSKFIAQSTVALIIIDIVTAPVLDSDTLISFRLSFFISTKGNDRAVI